MADLAYVRHLLRSKGPAQTVNRFSSIVRRLGPTSTKVNDVLAAYVALTAEFGACPTFPTPARVAVRHAASVRRLLSAGVDIAVHGDVHIDHSLRSPADQMIQIRRAVERLQQAGIPFSGFRAPYLRWNDGTMMALRAHGFRYDSSLALYWDVLDTPVARQDADSWRLLLDFYRPLDAALYPAFPFEEKGLLRLPVSLPDDEMLLERAKLPDGKALAEPWLRILDQTYRQGGLFVLQLHPERFPDAMRALQGLLTEARRRQPPVWLATLAEITTWWVQRQRVTFRLQALQDGWQVTVEAPAEVTVLGRHVVMDEPQQHWADGWQIAPPRSFHLQGGMRPTIGLSESASPALAAFLHQMGFWTEKAMPEHRLVLEQTTFAPEDAFPLLRRLVSADVPLLRFNPWPRLYRSALAITGDLDSFTWWDYLDRLWVGGDDG